MGMHLGRRLSKSNPVVTGAEIRALIMVAVRPQCPGCQQRDRRILELERENRKLRRQLDDSRREKHRQAHPFRRAQTNAAHAPAKKPGRPKGHQADLRPIPTLEQIDRVIEVPLKECPLCHVPVDEQDQVVQFQTDLPPIVPIVTQFNIETGWCPCCRQRWQGRHPEQTSDAKGAAGNTLGPVVLTMAAEMKHRLGVSYRKICDFLQTYCNLKACPAAFVRAEKRLADLARPTYDLLLDALRRAQVVHADETGWRIGRANAWLWVFSSKQATIYAIRHSRGSDVPQEILGPDFDGYLLVDGGKAYELLSYTKGQCNGHLLRRLHNLKDTVSKREQQFLQELSTLLQEAIDLAQRRDDLTPEGYGRRVQEIDNRLEDWLLDRFGRYQFLSADLKRLAKHVANHRDEWLLFLRVPEVPPTNNHAEQMLRPAVITRKIGGCNKNLWGALVHSILASIMVSCHRQGKRFLDLARQLWRSDQPPAIAMETLPASPATETLPQPG
jgi:transposase